LNTAHRGVHDAGAVGTDGVGDVADVNGVQVLIVTGLLNKDLYKENKNMSGKNALVLAGTWIQGRNQETKNADVKRRGFVVSAAVFSCPQ
jgi:hypothetical protein